MGWAVRVRGPKKVEDERVGSQRDRAKEKTEKGGKKRSLTHHPYNIEN